MQQFEMGILHLMTCFFAHQRCNGWFGNFLFIYYYSKATRSMSFYCSCWYFIFSFLSAVSTFCVCEFCCCCAVYLINSTNYFSCLSQYIMGQNGPTGTHNCNNFGNCCRLEFQIFLIVYIHFFSFSLALFCLHQ